MLAEDFLDDLPASTPATADRPDAPSAEAFLDASEQRARATVYTRFDDGPQYFDGRTAQPNPLTGKALAQEGVTIAVDPAVIPYGSKVRIPKLAGMSANGDGIFIAHDTGGAVKSRKASGGNEPIIDVFVDGSDQRQAQARRDALAKALGTDPLDYEIVENGQTAEGFLEDAGYGAADYLVNAMKRGSRQSDLAMEMRGTPDAGRLAENQRAMDELPASPEMRRFNEAKTVGDAWSAFAHAPLQITGELFAESMASFVKTGAQVAPERIAQGAAIGGTVGSAVPGLGTAAGLAGGARSGFVVGMGETSYALESSGKFLESLQEQGVDVRDARSIEKAFANPQIIEKARNGAVAKGVPIAAFDGFSALIGGRMFSKPAKTILGKLLHGSAELGTQVALGMGGETAGELAAGEKLSPSAIMAEGLGELGPGSVEIATGLLTREHPAIATENAPSAEEFLDEGTPADLSQVSAATTSAAPPAPTEAAASGTSGGRAMGEPAEPAPAGEAVRPESQAPAASAKGINSGITTANIPQDDPYIVRNRKRQQVAAMGYPTEQLVKMDDAQLDATLASGIRYEAPLDAHTRTIIDAAKAQRQQQADRRAFTTFSGEAVPAPAPIEPGDADESGLTVPDDAELADIPFAKQPGTPEAREEQRLQGIVRDQWRAVGERNGPRVLTVKDAADVPDDLGGKEVRTAVAGGKSIVEAYFLPERKKRDGTVIPRQIVIVQSGAARIAAQREMTTDQRIRQLALHELVHHYGSLSAIFHEDGKALRDYNKIIDGILTRLAKTEPKTLAWMTTPKAEGGYGFDLSNAADRAHAAEEYLARQHEGTKAAPGWVAKTIAEIKQLLRRLFPKLQWTDADVRAFLDSARRRAEKTATEAGSASAQVKMAAQPVTKEREHVATTGRMTEVADTVKDRLQSYYDTTTADATNRAANDRINALGIDGAFTEVMAAPLGDETSMALAHHLALRLQTAGQDARAVAVRNKMAESATDHARALWYIATIAKTPAEKLQQDAAKITQQAMQAEGLSEELKKALAEIERLTKELADQRHGHATDVLTEIERIIADATKLPVEERTRLKLKLREILMEATNPESSVQARDKLTGVLKAAGMKPDAARKLAERMIRDVQKRMQKALGTLLQTLGKLPAKAMPIPRTALEKLTALNNAGKLDESGFHETIAKRFGIPVFTPAMATKIQNLQREYDAATNPELKLAFGLEMMDAMHSMVPATLGAKAKAVQVLAMLFGRPLVALRNIAGNVMMGGGNLAADGLHAWVMSPTLSMVFRDADGARIRTQSSLAVAERISGLAQPWRDYQAGLQHARDLGRDPTWRDGLRVTLALAKLTSRGVLEMSDIKRGQASVFTSRTMRLIEDALTLQQGVFDRAFWSSAFQASLRQQLDAAKANGRDLLAPTPEMVTAAQLEANRAIFTDDNWLSACLKGAEKLLNGPRLKDGKFVFDRSYGLGSATIAFAKIPGSIGVQGAVDFSPFGFLKLLPDIGHAIQGRPLDHRRINQILARATVGSAGLVGMGYYLAALGILSALPDDDKDREALRRKAGLGAYRINVSALFRLALSGNVWTRQEAEHGDKILTYDWAQPIAIPLAMGAQAHAAQEQAELAGKRGKWTPPILWQAAAGGLRSLETLPMLSGISRLLSNVTYSGVVGGAAETVVAMPSNFVPGIFQDLNKFFDNTLRETRAGNPIDRELADLKSRIPGLAQTLPPKHDLLGDVQTRYQAGTNMFLNVYLSPATQSRIAADPVLQEIDRLYLATGDRGVIPNVIRARTMKVNGKDLELTNEQISQMQRYVGLVSLYAIRDLMAAPGFAEMPDTRAATAFGNIIRDTATAAKIDILGQSPYGNPPGAPNPHVIMKQGTARVLGLMPAEQ